MTEMVEVPVQMDLPPLICVTHEHDVYVLVRPMCEALGIDDSTQTIKIKGDPSFNCRDIPTVARDGKMREHFAIRRDSFMLWLGGINTNKVSANARPALIAYKQQAARKLDDLYQQGFAMLMTDEINELKHLVGSIAPQIEQAMATDADAVSLDEKQAFLTAWESAADKMLSRVKTEPEVAKSVVDVCMELYAKYEGDWFYIDVARIFPDTLSKKIYKRLNIMVRNGYLVKEYRAPVTQDGNFYNMFRLSLPTT